MITETTRPIMANVTPCDGSLQKCNDSTSTISQDHDDTSASETSTPAYKRGRHQVKRTNNRHIPGSTEPQQSSRQSEMAKNNRGLAGASKQVPAKFEPLIKLRLDTTVIGDETWKHAPRDRQIRYQWIEDLELKQCALKIRQKEIKVYF